VIKIWSSYSCNNSTSYRLIARFANHATATTIAAELLGLMAELRTESDSGIQAMSRVYGFDWEDEGYGGEQDGPFATVDEEVVIVHLEYGDGLGPGVPAYLAERGGQVERQRSLDVHVSVLVRADSQLDEALTAVAARPATGAGKFTEFTAPWIEHHARGEFASYRDAGVIWLWFPSDARDLARLRGWLSGHGIENPVIQLDRHEDHALFTALGFARCTACDGALEYLDPRLHDIESPQLVCRACGGLYELAAFT